MDKPQKKFFRCAIYTRKSTDHNLELEFNSLDAQREACEAYIKSQAHEGWRLVPAHYDDGAFSGASLDRPALQELLAEIRSGKIDIIVVYKVDRLTRSLADFAKLVELFDQHSVAFVSVTQSFNTTSSMGRLTLNVLLSFAQFEREVIGERVRDKIAASKRKGIWVGGPIPLGYASVNKKLVVVPEEAETVRQVFRGYLKLKSIGTLVGELDRDGLRTRRRVRPDGSTRGSRRFGPGPIAHMLKNRFYIGEIAYGGEIHRGEHEPILDRALFEAVQTTLAANGADRQLRLKSSPAMLTGRIFDDRGNRMSPTHTNKRGVRYRYYLSQAVLQKRNEEAGSVTRVPAPEIEALVIRALRERLGGAEPTDDLPIANDRDFIEHYAHRVIVRPDALEIQLAELATGETEHGDLDPDGSDSAMRAPGSITIPWTMPSFTAVKGIVHAPSQQSELKPETQEALLTAIAKARGWIDDLVHGRVSSFAEIARLENKVERHIRLLAPLAFVSPSNIAAIVAGSAKGAITITGLAKRLSLSWEAQERHLVDQSAKLK